jgi:hypothetical protein
LRRYLLGASTPTSGISSLTPKYRCARSVPKAVFGVGRNTERRTKAIALYIGAAAKWARIKFDVTHDPRLAMLADAAASQKMKRRMTIAVLFSADVCTAQF